MRAIPLALRAGLKCRVMHVTDGKDPDEFIRKEGRAAFEELLKNAKPGMDYQVDSTLAACDTETLGAKWKRWPGAALFLDCTSDVEVGERIRDLARRLSIDEGLIQSEYRKLTHQDGKQKPFNPEWLTQKQVKLTSPTEQAERLVLRAFLEGIPLQPGQGGNRQPGHLHHSGPAGNLPGLFPGSPAGNAAGSPGPVCQPWPGGPDRTDPDPELECADGNPSFHPDGLSEPAAGGSP